ncbi:MAG: PAS domain S-box protein [Acidobacteria bacterium]|nr:PAS domain S-box protein [Acidobacteriota bacterium]
MGRLIRSIAFRFGIPLLGFGLILFFSYLVKDILGFNIDLTVLLIATLIVTAWYAGRGPGIFIALVFEAVIVVFSPPLPTGRTVFVTVNRLALFLSLVVFTSSRRAAESRLREQGETLAVTLRSIGDAVIATDAAGRVNFINPTAERLTGWTSAEAAGRPLEEVLRLVSEDTGQPVESPFAGVVREGVVVGLANHTLLVARDGTEIPIEDSGAPIRDAAGKIVGVIIVFHDVTARRAAEREREALLESEHAARLEAETAGRLKDEFLAVVSHELRTPLSAILGWATMLRTRRVVETEAPNVFEIIERNARAQGEIIDDLIDVSRITTGRLTIAREPVAIVPVIESAVESMRPLAEAKSLALDCALPDDDGVVIGDETRLRQIVWNLLSNAVKFTPEGGRVELRAACRDGRIEIAVSDTGIGIAPEFLPFVFDKFRQGDASTTRPHGGLGLGLSIVRHLVRLHDGTIGAASEGAGRGARFTVSLPLAENLANANSAGAAI